MTTSYRKYNCEETLPYCDCDFPNSIQIITSKGNSVHQLCKCNCFDDDDSHNEIEWTWDRETADTQTFIDGNKLTFHPEYSQGSQIIRGNKRLKPGMIHYWEIQICTCLTGTDEMFGIGTDKVDLHKYKYEFISALGYDSQSWAYSYRGIKQHDGFSEKYGKKITRGCIVGVYLDLCHGYLEFYLNRHPLGVAYKNIPCDQNIHLYPMICSTSSRSSVRLINSSSHIESLEFKAIRCIGREKHNLEDLRQLPGLKRLLNKYWFVLPQAPRYSYRSKKNELPLDDEVVLSKRTKKIGLKYDEPIINDISDIYTDIKIPIKHPDDLSDDEFNYSFWCS